MPEILNDFTKYAHQTFTLGYTMSSLSSRLKRYRKENNLSQRALSQKIGISDTQLRKIE